MYKEPFWGRFRRLGKPTGNIAPFNKGGKQQCTPMRLKIQKLTPLYPLPPTLPGMCLDRKQKTKGNNHVKKININYRLNSLLKDLGDITRKRALATGNNSN